MKKIDINWTLLAKAVGITTALIAYVAAIAALARYAPFVLGLLIVALLTSFFYFLLKCMED